MREMTIHSAVGPLPLGHILDLDRREKRRVESESETKQQRMSKTITMMKAGDKTV